MATLAPTVRTTEAVCTRVGIHDAGPPTVLVQEDGPPPVQVGHGAFATRAELEARRATKGTATVGTATEVPETGSSRFPTVHPTGLYPSSVLAGTLAVPGPDGSTMVATARSTALIAVMAIWPRARKEAPLEGRSVAC